MLKYCLHAYRENVESVLVRPKSKMFSNHQQQQQQKKQQQQQQHKQSLRC